MGPCNPLLGLSKKEPLLEASPISENLFLQFRHAFYENAHILLKMQENMHIFVKMQENVHIFTGNVCIFVKMQENVRIFQKMQENVRIFSENALK